MDTAAYIARMIGPLLVLNSVAVLLQGNGYRAMAQEFLGSRALVYLTGFMTLVLGLGIVNAWKPDWPLVLTLIGWLFVVGGAFRMLFTERAIAIGKAMLDRMPLIMTAGIIQLVVGLVLSHIGYVR